MLTSSIPFTSKNLSWKIFYQIVCEICERACSNTVQGLWVWEKRGLVSGGWKEGQVAAVQANVSIAGHCHLYSQQEQGMVDIIQTQSPETHLHTLGLRLSTPLRPCTAPPPIQLMQIPLHS